MKKTKVIVKKPKAKQPRQRQRQKQKQSVNVNVNIDQSKRTTPRKPKSDAASTTTMPHGENYIKPSALSNLQPVVYQQPYNQVYGQLQPVGNTSDSMNRMIENGQNYNAVVPHQRQEPNNNPLFSTGPTYNYLSLALEARKVQDEINSGIQTAEAYSKLKENATVEFIDEEQDNEEPMPDLEPIEPESTVQSSSFLPDEQPDESQSQSQSQSQVIEKPIDSEKVNRTYLAVLKAEQVRNYAIQLGIETKKPNKKKVGQYDNISKNDLISAIIQKLNENK